MKPYIIAEIGMNFNGDLNQAVKLIEEAKAGGFDAVKFQLWQHPSSFCQPGCEAWETFLQNTLSFKDFEYLYKVASETDIDCSASVFDRESTQLLKSLHAPWVKVASCYGNRFDFIDYLIPRFSKIFISTGLVNKDELEQLKRYKKFAGLELFSCVSEYPAMGMFYQEPLFAKVYGGTNGLSDHTESATTAVEYAMHGHKYFEKHVTLDNNAEGPDHSFSLHVSDFKSYTEAIRKAYKKADSIHHDSPKRYHYLTYLHANQNIKKNCIITMDMLKFTRAVRTVDQPETFLQKKETGFTEFHKMSALTDIKQGELLTELNTERT